MALKILFVSAEAAPFAKVGGLADVAAGLPRALAALGHDVRVVLPRYAAIDERFQLSAALEPFPVPWPRAGEASALGEARQSGVHFYFVDSERYFRRPDIYAYPDDLERFCFFCRAVMEALRRLGWCPDVLHANDWHSGLLPAWLATSLRHDPFFGATASLFTIHNLAFQGWFDEPFRARWRLVPRRVAERAIGGVQLYNTMALGIAYADLVTTVSETYAREILTPGLGERLDPLLRARKDRLFGIVNGIDDKLFDPATDRAIACTYDVDSLERKALNKAALQREIGLPLEAGVPLVANVGRLAEQKGFDLMAEALGPAVEEQPFQFVLLGTGEERYQRVLGDLAERYPERVAVRLAFEPALAQRVYAGADMFLMPSRFEPCGLGQLIALRYGTVPIVRATGGLADTVQDFDPRAQTGTGFVFRAYHPAALAMALARALEAYRQPEWWRGIQVRAMQRDVSWRSPALRYGELYRKAIASRRGAEGGATAASPPPAAPRPARPGE